MAYDLQNLGFIPEDVGDDVLREMSGPLGRILSQLSGGGGATKLNIDAGQASKDCWGHAMYGSANEQQLVRHATGRAQLMGSLQGALAMIAGM